MFEDNSKQVEVPPPSPSRTANSSALKGTRSSRLEQHNPLEVPLELPFALMPLIRAVFFEFVRIPARQ